MPSNLSGGNVSYGYCEVLRNERLTISLGGGSGYVGSTVCTASATCSTQNPCMYLGFYVSPVTVILIDRKDYAQCIPATAAVTTTTSATTTSKTTMVTSTTSATSTTKGSTTTTSTTTAATVTNSGNPFSGYQLYANPYYSSEVYSLAIPSLTSSLAAKASAVAKVPSFVWLYVLLLLLYAHLLNFY